MKSSRINYAVVGAFVLLMVAALIVTVATLTGRTGATETYFSTYDNVSGVMRGTKVMYEGFGIGQVDRIDPVQEEGRLRFRVALKVRQGWPMPEDSVARIAASGLLSAVAIDIRGGRSATLIPPGGTLPSGGGGNIFAVMGDVANEVSSLSQNGLKPLLSTVNKHIENFGTMLDQYAPEILGNLIALSGDLAKTSPEISENMRGFSAELNTSGKQLNKLLSDQNVAKAGDVLNNLERFSSSFSQLATDLESTRKKVDALLVSMNSMVGDNKEDVDESVRELRRTLQTVSRHIGEVMQNIESTSRNMNEFSRQVRQNPTSLIGGGNRDEGPNRR